MTSKAVSTDTAGTTLSSVFPVLDEYEKMPAKTATRSADRSLTSTFDNSLQSKVLKMGLKMCRKHDREKQPCSDTLRTDISLIDLHHQALMEEK